MMKTYRILLFVLTILLTGLSATAQQTEPKPEQMVTIGGDLTQIKQSSKQRTALTQPLDTAALIEIGRAHV